MANIVADAALYGVLAYGLALRIRAAGVYDFSYFGLFAVGGYAYWAAAFLLELPSVVSVLAALLVTAATGVAIDRWIIRDLSAKHRTLGALIASLGVMVVIENALALLAGPDNKVLRHGPAYSVPIGPWAVMTDAQIGAVVGAIVLLLGTSAALRLSRWGARFRAVASNRDLALAHGLQPWLVVTQVQVLIGVLAGLAGIVFALDRDLTPDMPLRPMLLVTAAVAIGGLSRNMGPVVGAGVVAATWHCAGVLIDTRWQDAAVFTLLLAVLVLNPRGLAGAFVGDSRRV